MHEIPSLLRLNGPKPIPIRKLPIQQIGKLRFELLCALWVGQHNLRQDANLAVPDSEVLSPMIAPNWPTCKDAGDDSLLRRPDLFPQLRGPFGHETQKHERAGEAETPFRGNAVVRFHGFWQSRLESGDRSGVLLDGDSDADGGDFLVGDARGSKRFMVRAFAYG